MNIYSVYSDSSKKNNDPLIIKSGFSFVALIFNCFWAFYHKMWSLGLFVFIGDIIVRNYADSNIAYFANIAILFVFGFFAPDLREYYAKKNNYELDDIIIATNEDEAEVKYYARMEETRYKG